MLELINNYIEIFRENGYSFDNKMKKIDMDNANYFDQYPYDNTNKIYILPTISGNYEYNTLLLSIGINNKINDIIYELLTSDDYYDLDPDRIYIEINKDDKENFKKLLSLFKNRKDHFIKTNTEIIKIYYDKGIAYDREELGVDLIINHIKNNRYINICMIKNRKYTTSIININNILLSNNKAKTIFHTSIYLPLIDILEDICRKQYVDQKEFERIVINTRILPILIHENYNKDIIDLLIKQCVKDGKNLGINKSFIYLLIEKSINMFNEFLPNISIKKDDIKNFVMKLEDDFQNKLLEGEKLLSQIKEIDSKSLYALTNDYSFPMELLTEYDVNLRKEDYSKIENIKDDNKELSLNILANYNNESSFVGYDLLGLETTVIDIIKDNLFVDELDDIGYIFLKDNPFYAENGGQISDIGYIKNDNVKIEVLDVIKTPNDQQLLKCRVLDGILHKGDKVLTHVLKERRESICKNHTVAHLLQHILSNLLGNKCIQKGAKVSDETFRFDFSYEGKLSDEIIIKVEQLLNEEIDKKLEVKTEIMDYEEALKNNILHMDNHLYNKSVRVVTVGDSVSLCGGTHVKNTSEITHVAIVDVSNKGLNTYRIEGACDDKIIPVLYDYIKPYNDEMMKLLAKSKKIIEDAKINNINLDFNFEIDNSKPTGYKDIIFNRLECEKLKTSVNELEKQYNKLLEYKVIDNLSLFINANTISKKGVNIIVSITKNYNIDTLKAINDAVLNRMQNVFVLLANITNDKITFASKTNTKDDTINCGNIVKELSLKCFGNGGGNKFSAQGGGTDISNLDNYLKSLKKDLIDNH